MGLVISVQNRTAGDVGINDNLFKSGVTELVAVKGPPRTKLETLRLMMAHPALSIQLVANKYKEPVPVDLLAPHQYVGSGFFELDAPWIFGFDENTGTLVYDAAVAQTVGYEVTIDGDYLVMAKKDTV